MARFTGISVLTRDVIRLATFYGMALQAAFAGDETHAEVHTEGASLAIDALSEVEELAPGSTGGCGTGGYLLEFSVENVDREYERLAGSGVTVVKPLVSYPWGRRAAWFRDPDGNLMNFYTDLLSPSERKEIVRSYFLGLLNERDLSVCDRLLAPDYVDHDAPAETPPGPNETRTFVGRFLAEYPDLHVQIEEMIAEGEKVVVRLVWRGTHGVTGAPYHRTGIAILRLNTQGQIVERWSAYAPA